MSAPTDKITGAAVSSSDTDLSSDEQTVSSIDRIISVPDYQGFFNNYLFKNRPCILPLSCTAGWKSRQEWTEKTGHPNFEVLTLLFGDAIVPVANCKQKKFSAHPKQELSLRDYLKYWKDYIQSGYPDTGECLYLKDWHFRRKFPEYEAYKTPEYFSSDWLNEFWDCKEDGSGDDYRFVYMGPKGSWTPFHADVIRSYSWSANICGRKKWILFPPGEEECLRDRYGQLVYDVDDQELCDSALYPKYHELKHRIEVIQEEGEIIYVPSGWHHQVYNMEDTISINHNWLNGCNVEICWNFLKQSLTEVQQEISDCRDMEGWHQQCQLILKSSSGIDYEEFYTFMELIATHRLDLLSKNKPHVDIDSTIPSVTQSLSLKKDVCETGDGKGRLREDTTQRDNDTSSKSGDTIKNETAKSQKSGDVLLEKGDGKGRLREDTTQRDGDGSLKSGDTIKNETAKSQKSGDVLREKDGTDCVKATVTENKDSYNNYLDISTWSIHDKDNEIKDSEDKVECISRGRVTSPLDKRCVIESSRVQGNMKVCATGVSSNDWAVRPFDLKSCEQLLDNHQMNHIIFDLFKIRLILRDMLEREEFRLLEEISAKAYKLYSKLNHLIDENVFMQ